MAMFDYKDYSSSDSLELMQTTHQLAAYSSISGVMGLPTREIIQWGANNLLPAGFTPNPIQLDLPQGWRELTPAELGLPASAVDFAGHYTITSPLTGNTPTGPQAKILGEFDSAGKLTRIGISFTGTNSPLDVVDYAQLNEGSIAPNMEPLLNAVKGYAVAQGMPAEKVLVTGYSLGGGMTNIMARFKDTLADGFFDKSVYIGHASPVIHDSPDVFNMGYENDVVHRAAGDAPDLSSAIAAAKPGLVNNDKMYASSTDNIVLFNDAYASPLWAISPLSILNPVAWSAHMGGLTTDAISRIGNSAFYQYTDRDSVVVVDSLSGLTRGTTWVEDKASHSSDHYGRPAFLIGNDYGNLLKGGAGGDYIDAGAGDDKIRTGAGADRVDGGAGTDTLILEGSRANWDVYRMNDGTLFFNAKNGNGLKQVHNVEKVTFDGDAFSNITPYTVTANGLSDHRFKLLAFLNNDIAFGQHTEGSAGNDALSGKTVFGQDGNDLLSAVSSGSLLHGGTGNDVLRGGAGDDALYGAEGNDVLYGGGGHNTLYGGVGHDIFLFDNSAGSHAVKDFNACAGDRDTLQLHGLFADQAALKAAARQSGSDVQIDSGATHITVQNTTLDQVLAHSVLI